MRRDHPSAAAGVSTAGSEGADIRLRALRAFALNRTPGFHFPGNFLGVCFTFLSPRTTRVALEPGAFCADHDGQVNFGAVALLADMTLASVVRANLNPAQRLATVSMHLQLTGEPITGPLEGISEFMGFVHDTAGRQGMSRARLTAGGREVLFGSGAFMVLDPPPGVTMHPVVNADHSKVLPLAEDELTREEQRILARIDQTLAAPEHTRDFLRRLWGQQPHATQRGATCRTDNGPHLGNRVGHVQGGIQVGLAAVTACAAVPEHWRMTSVTASYISPGQGRVLRTSATRVHQGRQTAAVRTLITGLNGRRVLEVLSTHARRGHPSPAKASHLSTPS